MDDAVRITVLPGNRVVSAQRGAKLLDALRSAGVFVEASCGGEGRCGRCAVELLDGVVDGPVPENGPRSARLSCGSSVMSDCAIRLLAPSRSASWVVSNAKAPAGPLFMAIDVGTTTVSAALSCIDAEPFAECRRLNPQAAWGSDVLRRLGAAADPVAANDLKRAVRSASRGLAADLLVAAKADPDSVRACAVACNSAMAVLLLGFDPGPLSVAPFESGLDDLGFVALDPDMFGLIGTARCELLPSIGGFVGADTIAGVIACGLDSGDRPALFIDAGTNGEIVLAPIRGPMLAASAAAGPAFEGGHLSCGGPAVSGAVHSVWIRKDGAIGFSAIGGVGPNWICGSGALQLVAALLECGALEPSGRMTGKKPVNIRPGGGPAVEIGNGASPLFFTQADVREVQLAVGAIRAAWRSLAGEARVELRDLKRIVLTGSFGGALDAEASRRIGLIPDVSARVEVIGSGAIRGALAVAAGRASRAGCADLAHAIRHVPLHGDGFQQLFIQSLELRPSS